MEISVIDNEAEKCFETIVNGHLAKIEYIKAKGSIYLTHTEVPKEFGGKGIGSQLVLKSLQHIEEAGLLLAPLCPFVAAYLKRHPEWSRLLAPGYNV